MGSLPRNDNTPLSPMFEKEQKNHELDGVINSPIMHTTFSVPQNDIMEFRPPSLLVTPRTGDSVSPTESGGTKDASSDNSTTSSNTHNNNDDTSSKDAYKMDITKMDQEVSRILKQLEVIEKRFDSSRSKATSMNSRTGNNTSDEADGEHGINIEEIQHLIDHFKSTILRLNLKNTLVKNELSGMKDEYGMERFMLVNQIENLEQTLRIIQNENNAVNSRNLKLIKYIKMLKTEKLKHYITENHKLRERVELLEKELNLSLSNTNTYSNSSNTHTPGYYSMTPNGAPGNLQMLPSPLSIPTTASAPVNMQYSRSLGDEERGMMQGRPAPIHSPNNMLDTLGRLATEYLHNEYPNGATNSKADRGES